jgi:hypothetical protein
MVHICEEEKPDVIAHYPRRVHEPQGEMEFRYGVLESVSSKRVYAIAPKDGRIVLEYCD